MKYQHKKKKIISFNKSEKQSFFLPLNIFRNSFLGTKKGQSNYDILEKDEENEGRVPKIDDKLLKTKTKTKIGWIVEFRNGEKSEKLFTKRK